MKPISERLDRIVKGWKSYTSRVINQASGRCGTLWARDYFDRYIRDEEHLHAARAYVRENPVKARLCARADDWEFGSASWGRRQNDHEDP